MLLSTGALIVDTILYDPPQSVSDSLYLGGAGIYALYGMRCWAQAVPSTSSGLHSKELSFIALIGHSCPISIQSDYLDRLSISLYTIDIPRQHPRAVNTLHRDTGVRDFYFVTPEEEYARYFRLKPHQVPDTLLSTDLYVHVISSHQRMMQWSLDLKAKAHFFWEPSPGCCIASEFTEFLKALPLTTMTSPNHYELAALVGPDRIQHYQTRYPMLNNTHVTIHVPNNKTLMDYYNEVILLLILKDVFIEHALEVILVVRAGEKGCILMDQHYEMTILPAYWDIIQELDHVVDVTGAGNAFMGGLVAGYRLSQHNSLIACVYATISASFAVEQMGLPIFDPITEQWNTRHSQPYQRFQAYIDKLKELGLDSIL